MIELLSAGWLSQALVAVCELRLADAVSDRAQTASEIAARSGLDADGVGRLLRALAQHGVFVRDPDGRFRANALSRTLRGDHASSVRDFALFLGSARHREHWSSLARSVARGESSLPYVRGGSFFEYARAEPEFGGLFGRAMTNLSALSLRFVLGAYDFARFRSIVDVGGGEGRFLRAILERAQDTRGVVFDLPEVIARVERAPSTASARLSFCTGSFFESLPAGHDGYLLKHVLHDWSDGQAERILSRAREAMSGRADARLLIIEMVLPEDGAPHVGHLIDLEMLLSVDGRERTRSEFARLLARSGFALRRVVETASPLSLIEAELG